MIISNSKNVKDINDINEFIERLRRNEEIAHKFFEIEVSILSITNFKDLFERLLTEIRDKFEIPYVWISLIGENDVVHFIRDLASSEVLRQRLNIIEKETLLKLVADNTKPLIFNEDLSHFYRLFPPHEKYLIKSVAIAPITLNHEIIGSLNLGDPSSTRYCPGMDTTLLERLTVKISSCLSNVAAHEKLRLAASHDHLTGLLNRRVMESILEREFKRALRYESPLSLVLLDLDGFKTINDRYGHDVGDEVLRYVGKHFATLSRETDVVARFAGDEFVIILPSTTLSEAHKKAERLKTFLQKNPLMLDRITIPVTFSYGIAMTQDPGIHDPASLLKWADEMLYEDKRRKEKDGRVIQLER
ncbi:MAG: sensor domain-containing diguanylate cyclase [Deltaproteobacteria bacterium]|nr:sensor domain-containing diguanylate cyclase [Deltaproteobacteria bacterium]MBW2084500.1 sensor domain-containing diguanylate cyclase [Deltaproteobacteria bacterium]